MSNKKVKQFEGYNQELRIHKIQRSRKVGQSYFTSIISTLLALVFSIPIIFKIKPEILIVNGPGTCLPLCVAASFLRVITKISFSEMLTLKLKILKSESTKKS